MKSFKVTGITKIEKTYTWEAIIYAKSPKEAKSLPKTQTAHWRMVKESSEVISDDIIDAKPNK